MTLIWWGFGLLVLIVWVATLVDVFRRADLSTGVKAGWALAIIVFPVIGTIVYVIARPKVVDYGPASKSPEAAEKAHEEAEAIARARAAEQGAPDEGRFNIR